MSDRLRVITESGKKILLIDFSHCTTEEMFPLLDDVQRLVAKSPRGSLLTLADFTSAQIDKATATRIKEVLTLDRPYVKRSAWVGTESLPKVFYENFKAFSRREFPTFKTREAALEWLIKE
ncbi:MAG TPA: hypothetical protein VFI95_24780 [Terriglobales bacterium]|nr:hypothetical protein [Terriglobales bacterium]